MSNQNPDMKDYFISYNNADLYWAEWVAWQLEEAGYSVILQAWDFKPGSNFVLDMQEAVTQAERTIAILSPDYLDSDFAQPEWAAAFAQDLRSRHRKLIPVRVRKVVLEGLLKSIVHIDLVGLDDLAAKTALLSGVSNLRDKPETPPGFPGEYTRAITEEPPYPGNWPLIWNLQLIRNPKFIGREILLTQIRIGLTSETENTAVQVLYGLGGIGKTQIVLEYAYRYKRDYYVIWWLPAEKPASLATAYANIASAMNLPEILPSNKPLNAKEKTHRIEVVRSWLERNEDWLLIFDNAKDLKAIREYLPRQSRGHILITSRNPNWLSLTKPLSVEKFDREDAIDFLSNRSGQTDELNTGTLVDELGCLPLALEQAGAYIEETGLSFSEYLALFRTERKRILQLGEPSTWYTETVATTWEISFKRIEKKSVAGRDLLTLSAFFAPEDIPINLFSKWKTYLPESLANVDSQPLVLVDARAVLRSYSLINPGSDAISIHRLVQAVIIDRLSKEVKEDWAMRAAGIVNEAFLIGNESHGVLARLLPHGLSSAEHTEKLNIADEITGQLFLRIGMFLLASKLNKEAKKYFEKSLILYERSYGPNDPNVANVLNNLGSTLRLLGMLEEARSHLERALSIDESAYGDENPQIVADLFNLGLVFFDIGDKAEAYECIERAVQICVEHLGEDHPDTVYIIDHANSLNW